MISVTLLSDNKSVGRVIFDGQRVRFERVPQRFVDEWTNHGVVGPGTGPALTRVVFPKDGERFVRALPSAISGTYLRAKLD